jgi:hypothetical protein
VPGDSGSAIPGSDDQLAAAGVEVLVDFFSLEVVEVESDFVSLFFSLELLLSEELPESDEPDSLLLELPRLSLR